MANLIDRNQQRKESGGPKDLSNSAPKRSRRYFSFSVKIDCCLLRVKCEIGIEELRMKGCLSETIYFEEVLRNFCLLLRVPWGYMN